MEVVASCIIQFIRHYIKSKTIGKQTDQYLLESGGKEKGGLKRGNVTFWVYETKP